MNSFESLKCKGLYIYDIYIVEWGSFEICHFFADSILVKQ